MTDSPRDDEHVAKKPKIAIQTEFMAFDNRQEGSMLSLFHETGPYSQIEVNYGDLVTGMDVRGITDDGKAMARLNFGNTAEIYTNDRDGEGEPFREHIKDMMLWSELELRDKNTKHPEGIMYKLSLIHDGSFFGDKHEALAEFDIRPGFRMTYKEYFNLRHRSGDIYFRCTEDELFVGWDTDSKRFERKVDAVQETPKEARITKGPFKLHRAVLQDHVEARCHAVESISIFITEQGYGFWYNLKRPSRGNLSAVALFDE